MANRKRVKYSLIMAKAKTQYICTSCDAIYPAWQGKCTNCGEWNTIVRDNFDSSKLNLGKSIHITSKKLEDIDTEDNRISLSVNSFNKVLSGGLLKGQVILFAGEPGIGKSTLLTQICANSGINILYISGEESIEQISKRAKRITSLKDFSNTNFSDNTDLQEILKHIKSKEYDLVIVDSIQTVRSLDASGFPGSMNQIRECANYIIDYSKKNNISVIMIGQITKEGTIAGPKILEHMVDTVLYFEGDRKNDTRVLRVTKNRFGSTNEIAIFQMLSSGLEEVKNLEWFYTGELNGQEGVAHSIYVEGNTYFIIEVQALCSKSSFAYPKRVSNGYDSKRLEMMIAILTKKLGLKLEEFDIYVNIVGGIKIDDTSADLAIAVAIISSYKGKSIPAKSCYLGEVSLTGEIRDISKSEERNKKAKEFGFINIISSKKINNLREVLKLI